MHGDSSSPGQSGQESPTVSVIAAAQRNCHLQLIDGVGAILHAEAQYLRDLDAVDAIDPRGDQDFFAAMGEVIARRLAA